MADSAALNAAVWNGAVPLCVSLDAHEVAATTAPAPLFALLPRHSYLPLLSAAAAEHFQDVLPPCADDAWFDAAGLPLKWTLPVGVLHDLLGGGQLPWRLSVHFRGFPDATLLRCAGAEAVRAHLFNTLKVPTPSLVCWHCVRLPRLTLASTLRPAPTGVVVSRVWQRVRGDDAAIERANGPVAGARGDGATLPRVIRVLSSTRRPRAGAGGTGLWALPARRLGPAVRSACDEVRCATLLQRTPCAAADAAAQAREHTRTRARERDRPRCME